MQTTLLGLAILIILALVTALVGPVFIDWNQYRAEFEARASGLIGLQVRVAGPMEARLLPTPSLSLQRIDISRPGEAGAVMARKLNIEFALGALMRGEWKAAEVRLEGAEFALGLDGQGRLDWPAPLMPVDPDAVSIQRLDVVNSRVLLTDAASGANLLLDTFDFRGEVRSLAGPVRGEGSFTLAGQHYPYRVSASRAGAGDAGAVRVRLNIDPIDRPLIADAEAVISVDRGAPRFEGTLNLARPVGRTASGLVEPWRFSGRFRGDSTAAVLEHIEYQYGPDERAIKLKGDARLAFGARPQLAGVLSSAQIDLDRVLALPEPARRRPVNVVRTLAEHLAGTQRPPFPVKLGLSVENLTLAGATLQRLSGDVTVDDDGWDIETLDFRAPGLSQMRLSGRLSADGHGVEFRGPVKLEARDPRALVAWLGERADAQSVVAGILRVEGDVSLGTEMIAIDHFKAELDRMTTEGRLAYFWASRDRPPRIEAVLNAPQIDLDRAHTLAQAVLADIPFEWPREGALAVQIGRASLAGIEARRADVKMTFDPQGLEIDRLAIGDLGGTSLAAKGRIDTRAPGGTIALDLDTRALDGVVALAEKFSPQAASELRSNAQRILPAKLKATLAVNPRGGASRTPAVASVKIEGSAGIFRIDAQGEASNSSEALTIDSLPRLVNSNVNFSGRVDAGHGAALVELLGLARLVAVDAGPGRLDLAARGAFNEGVAIDGRLVARGLDIGATGTARMSGSGGPSADLSIAVATANVRAARAPLPAALTGRLTVADGAIGVTDLNGKIAGSEVGGRLKVGIGEPRSVDGDLTLGVVSLPAAIGGALGVPPSASQAAWPSEPFEAGVLGDLVGRVKVKLGRVVLTPTLAAADVTGVLRFDGSTLAFESIDGALAGGRVTGALTVRRGAEGLRAHSKLQFAESELAQLLPGDGQPPLSGRLRLDLDVEGSGRSPSALVGSLQGRGNFTVRDGRIARLDPATFETVMRSVDQGLPLDAQRIGDRVELMLGNGRLAVPLAEGDVAIADGQARLANLTVRSEGIDLAAGINLGLAEGTLDARLTLTGPAGAVATGQRPEIGIVLKGPVLTPKRTLEVAAFSSWLALRAVEHQAKRLDALESGREVPPSPYTSTLPAPAVPAAAPPVPPRLSSPSGQQRSVPSGEQAPALPPPVNIRPAPALRAPNGTPRPEAAPRQAQQPPRPAPASPPTIGILESLFGRQN